MATNASSAERPSETRWVRFRGRPAGHQIAIAGGAVLALLLAAYFFFGRPGDAAAPPPGPTPVGVMVVTEQPVTLSTELPGRTAAYENIRCAAAGRWHHPRPAVHRGRLCPGRPAALPHRSGDLRSARRQCPRRRSRAPRPRPSAPKGRSAAMPSCSSAISCRARITTMRCPPPATARADVAAQARRVAVGRNRPARTTIRAPISGRIGRSMSTSRRAGLGGAGECADHHPAARPDLCRYPAVERRPAARCAGRSWPGRSRATRRRSGSCLKPARCIRMVGNAAASPSHGRSGDRVADHPRRLPQSATPAAAGHVRARRARPGHPDRAASSFRSARSAATSAAGRPCSSSAPNNMAELRVIAADRTDRRQLAGDRRAQAAATR